MQVRKTCVCVCVCVCVCHLIPDPRSSILLFQETTHNTTVNSLRTSSIYSSLLNTVFVPPTAETKILRHRFTENTIKNVYLMPFKVTNEVKIIIFQYKVIHNVLPTRATLYRDGISESPLCNIEKQTLHHLLINCTIILDFWILFQDWWHQKTNETIMLSTSYILYGWHDRTKHWQVLNYCLLLAKYRIFYLRFSKLPTVHHGKA